MVKSPRCNLRITNTIASQYGPTAILKYLKLLKKVYYIGQGCSQISPAGGQAFRAIQVERDRERCLRPPCIKIHFGARTRWGRTQFTESALRSAHLAALLEKEINPDLGLSPGFFLEMFKQKRKKEKKLNIYHNWVVISVLNSLSCPIRSIIFLDDNSSVARLFPPTGEGQFLVCCPMSLAIDACG